MFAIYKKNTDKNWSNR